MQNPVSRAIYKTMINFINIHKLGLEKFNFIFLLLLILSIPTQETPKLIFWSLYVISSLFLLITSSQKRKWDLLDTLIVIWMLSGLIVAFFSGIQHKEWSGSTDLIIFTSILLILKKSDTSYDNINIIFYIILLSTLVASLLAIWQLVYLNNKEFIELHSVGHVNHSAIYLSLSLAVIIAILYTKWKTSRIASRIFLLSIYASIAITLVLTDSRAAILASVLLLVFFLYLFRKQLSLSLILISILLFFTGGNYFITGGGIIEKQIDQVERDIFFQARIKIWRSAILAWQQHPVFGVGIKNYDQVSLDNLLAWCDKGSDVCNPDDYLPYAHGHSLYINTLTERGLFGFFVVFINISMLIFLIYKYRPDSTDNGNYIMLWSAAFGMLFLNLIIGLFNTTLHHENALLSMIVIGLWLGKTYGRAE